jgi:hypothetical protein
MALFNAREKRHSMLKAASFDFQATKACVKERHGMLPAASLDIEATKRPSEVRPATPVFRRRERIPLAVGE